MKKEIFEVLEQFDQVEAAYEAVKIIKEEGVKRYVLGDFEINLEGNCKIGEFDLIEGKEEGPFKYWSLLYWCGIRQYFRIKRRFKAAGI